MSKKAKIILIIGIVLIILIGSYFWYRAWKKRKDEREGNKNKTGETLPPPSTAPSTTKEDAIVTIVYAKAGRKSADFATGYADNYLIAWANALKTPNTSVFKVDNKWYTTSDGKWTPLK